MKTEAPSSLLQELMAAQEQLASADDPEGIAAAFEASVNTVPPLDATRACAWSLQDHLQITGAPMLDLTGEPDEEWQSGGANNDEAGPSGGGGYTVKEEDFDVFNDR